MQRDKYTMQILLVILGTCFLIFTTIAIYVGTDKKSTRIIVDWNSPQFIGERSGKYSAIFANQKLDQKLSDKALQEFEDEKIEFAKAISNDELIRLYGISFKEKTLSDLAIECNSRLFEICNKYYLATLSGQQLSPLIPMAIANVETPGRGDTSVTYSSLFPSKCVPVNSADSISNMSCLAVLENPSAFKTLASDHWTRDRGAMQMNPNYGTEYEAFNSLMGPSEASILSNVNSMDVDFSTYAAYEPRNSRNIGVEDWLSMVSTKVGDRYNVKDSVLRIAAASQEAVDSYSKQYTVQNDMEIMALVAMNHNAGNLWSPSVAAKKVGNWRSGTQAYRYCSAISSTAFENKVRKLCDEKLSTARNENKPIPMTLERSGAKKLYEEAYADKIVEDYGSYIYEGGYYEVTYLYPIQALYAYTMLGLVYSGK